MNAFDKLAACAGTRRGTSTLQDPHSGKPLDSSSTLTVTPILRGLFLRVAYTWDYNGQPQEGEFIIGLQSESSTLSSYWIDTWHMSEKGLVCTGSADAEELSLPGSYPAPPGPDWGWNTVIRPSENEIKVTMFNVPPGGAAELAVEAHYQMQ
ncbi:MAG TPA: DUF1579 family protein [Verrucomicrobiales bacterium]|nr:DUF1579 family protein [Verrucomicrobiales bacterium]